MPDEPQSEEWNRYKRLVLEELRTNKGEIQEIRGEIEKLKIQFAVLQVKSGFIAGLLGLFAGAAPVAIALLMKGL